MELSDKLGEAEDIAQEHILDYDARNELDKEGYKIKREGRKLQATTEDTTINWGHGIKGVYYFSVSNKDKPLYLKIFPWGVFCKLKPFSSKLELIGIGGKKEWHIGVNPLNNQIYCSFSGPYKEARKKMLECAYDNRKK